MTSHCWGDRFHRINPGKLLNYERRRNRNSPHFQRKKITIQNCYTISIFNSIFKCGICTERREYDPYSEKKHSVDIVWCPINVRLVWQLKIINVICHVNKVEDKNRIFISLEAEKALDKIQHPSMVRTLNRLRIEEDILNLVKGILWEKPTANIIVGGKMLFHQDREQGQRCLVSSLPFSVTLEFLDNAMRQKWKHQEWKIYLQMTWSYM